MARDEAGPVQQDQRLDVNGSHPAESFSPGARVDLSVIAKLLQYAASRAVAKPSTLAIMSEGVSTLSALESKLARRQYLVNTKLSELHINGALHAPQEKALAPQAGQSR